MPQKYNQTTNKVNRFFIYCSDRYSEICFGNPKEIPHCY